MAVNFLHSWQAFFNFLLDVEKTSDFPVAFICHKIFQFFIGHYLLVSWIFTKVRKCTFCFTLPSVAEFVFS